MRNLSIILVEPQQPGNIGMVCRAMANFGVSDLRLVNPCQHLHPEARKFAVAAGQLLDDAKVFATLPEALADLQLSVATTRRSGRFRGELLDSTQLPARLAELPSESKIGLVFGREDAGLTSEEVAQCSLAATVAASGELGSLNLSQATLLILYELSRQPQLPVAVAAAARELPEQKELDGLYRQIDEILERIAFINPSRPEAVRHRVRQLFNRIGPDKEEVAFLRGMWSQIASSVNDWVGRRRG
jgi:tRNA/rRNA methyltransferase